MSVIQNLSTPISSSSSAFLAHSNFNTRYHFRFCCLVAEKVSGRYTWTLNVLIFSLVISGSHFFFFWFLSLLSNWTASLFFLIISECSVCVVDSLVELSWFSCCRTNYVSLPVKRIGICKCVAAVPQEARNGTICISFSSFAIFFPFNSLSIGWTIWVVFL